MAVHRGHQAGGQGKRGAICPGVGTPGNLPSVPHLLPMGSGQWDRRSRQPFRRQRIGFRAVIIPEWWAELSRNGLGEFPKAEPRIARNAPGLLMSRMGGWGVVSATVMQIIASP